MSSRRNRSVDTVVDVKYSRIWSELFVLDRRHRTANSDVRRVESPVRQAQRDSIPRQLLAADRICEPNRGLPIDDV